MPMLWRNDFAQQNRIQVFLNHPASGIFRTQWPSRLRVLLVLLLISTPAGPWLRAQGATPAPAPAAPAPAQTTTGQQQSGTPSTTQGNGSTNNGTTSNSNATQNQNQNQADRTTNNRESTGKDRTQTEQSQAVTAPDQPTEFQRLVTETTGASLPIFGSSLFSGVPANYVPDENIPVPADYVIGPGDELRIQVFGQQNQQHTFQVDRNGEINYPEVGTLHVAGLPYTGVQQYIQTQLSRIYRNFSVTVTLGQLRSIQIFVTGNARRPGTFTISPFSTLLNALFDSGGPSNIGSLRNIEVIRNNVPVTHFDLYDLLLRGDKSRDVKLQAGDVIFIDAVGPQIAVAGSVNRPGIYEIRPETTVSQAIELAGGRTNVALAGPVRLDRVFEHTMRSLLDVNPSQGREVEMKAGDILSISAILDSYKDVVTLRGNVAFPGRYAWHAGMRLTDLVATKEQLVTRAYYERRNNLANFTSGYTTGGGPSLQVGGSGLAQAQDNAVRAGASTNSSANGGSTLSAALTGSNSNFAPQTDVLLSAPDIDWSYAVIERLNPVSLSTELIPFNPGKLYLEGDRSQNLPLLQGDVVTFFSTADIKVPTNQQTRFVRLEGEFVSPGVYSVLPGETLRSLLRRAGGMTPEAYLFGSDFTRESTRRIQQQRLNEYADNLESRVALETANANAKAISDRDAAAAAASGQQAGQIISRLRRVVVTGRIVLELKPDSRGVEAVPDIALEDGDRFVLPRVPSTVSVEGQVYSANAFLFERGRRERDYLHQAGGPDRDSDAKRQFILRADGSVYSSQYGNVSRATMFPGDTVVVPPKLNHSSFFRDLVDFSTIFGQFGLIIAVLTTLR